MVILINFLKLIALVLCSAGVTAILNCYMKNRKFRVNALANIFIMTVVAVSLFMFGGISVWTVKGIVMALVLLYASVQDISTRKADDNLWIMLLILSLVNFGEHSVLSMILGGLVVFVPQLAIAIFSKNGGIGGADIKISTAAALCLGFFGGTLGYVIGLAFGIVFQLIYNKVKNRTYRKSFALLPFLSAGLMVGYFI